MNVQAQVFARPAPQLTKHDILLEKMRELQQMMRATAQYMQHFPDPYQEHAREMLGAAAMVRMWIRDIEDDWK